MYNFHYGYIKEMYGKKASLLFTDTDNLCYAMETENYTMIGKGILTCLTSVNILQIIVYIQIKIKEHLVVLKMKQKVFQFQSL